MIAHHLKRHSPHHFSERKVMRGTALHPGKDFAVSPFDFTQGKPRMYTKINPVKDPLSFRVRRHCSHLLDYPDRRYLLPSCHSHKSACDECSDFPPPITFPKESDWRRLLGAPPATVTQNYISEKAYRSMRTPGSILLISANPAGTSST